MIKDSELVIGLLHIECSYYETQTHLGISNLFVCISAYMYIHKYLSKCSNELAFFNYLYIYIYIYLHTCMCTYYIVYSIYQ